MSTQENKELVRRFYEEVVRGRIVEQGGAANMLGPLLKIGVIRIVGPENE